MIKSIGLDIVRVSRIKKLLKRYDERFVKRILGPSEIDLYEKRKNKIEFLSGRFAAKEAVIKALGPILENRPAYACLEIVNDNGGMPVLKFPEQVKSVTSDYNCLVSITHEKKYAAAVVIISEEK